MTRPLVLLAPSYGNPRTRQRFHDTVENAVENGRVEIVEAKSLADHGKVREAAAQLLDYAAHSPQPVTRLAALFPERPADGGVRYLHRLGIDCVHRRPDGSFAREDADDVRRQHMLPVWHGPV